MALSKAQRPERAEVLTHAFSRCDGGHYFEGEFCPFDGWSSESSRELSAAVQRLRAKDAAVTMKELRAAGVSSEALPGTVVMNFGSAAVAFEGLLPRELVVNGKAVAP